jgi:hypothetical protein
VYYYVRHVRCRNARANKRKRLRRSKTPRLRHSKRQCRPIPNIPTCVYRRRMHQTISLMLCRWRPAPAMCAQHSTHRLRLSQRRCATTLVRRCRRAPRYCHRRACRRRPSLPMSLLPTFSALFAVNSATKRALVRLLVVRNSDFVVSIILGLKFLLFAVVVAVAAAVAVAAIAVKSKRKKRKKKRLAYNNKHVVNKHCCNIKRTTIDCKRDRFSSFAIVATVVNDIDWCDERRFASQHNIDTIYNSVDNCDNTATNNHIDNNNVDNNVKHSVNVEQQQRDLSKIVHLPFSLHTTTNTKSYFQHPCTKL